MIRTVRKVPGKYVSETMFGFSAEKVPASMLPPDFFLELPERFSVAEIPGELIGNPLQTEGLFSVQASSLMESGILENISLHQTGLLRDCIAGIAGTVEQLVQKGVTSGVLDLDFSSIFSREQEQLYHLILKGLAFTLERYSFTILLPFSIPTVSPELILQAVRFLRQTLLPWVKIRLDIHCHELSPGYDPESMAGMLFPEVRSLRFLYLAESGNVLVPEHILPWIGSLSVYGFRGPCFFTPAASNLNGMPLWISDNESLLRKIEK